MSHTAHSHPDTIDWEAMATHLENNGELQLPVLRRTAARLKELLGAEKQVRRVLDVGSGPGVMTCVLAEAFPGAETVAVDGTPALLDRARTRAGRLGVGDRVTVHHTELPEGLTGLGTADVIWSSRVVHHLGDQQAALAGLADLLTPGGMLAVAEGGLPMRFLPRDIGIGVPGLQARLDAEEARWFQTMRSELPNSTSVIEDWPAMFTRAGLKDVGTFTYLLDLRAPLGDTARSFLHDHLTRMRTGLNESLDAADLATLDVLIDPDAPEGILRRPDAFLLSATTVFTGTR
ncbi:class I SAM-dependent methyltransferase [Actinocrispum wychmicini]|uniref:Ubiquinone/menaquinone biosynthesis C-methylase UbiE n=1 Tax=Actinocrispum wychmicini TaxID=1213861 RepID=A0A4R2JNQ4_9PSEU|nr:class I SAM-dependent methyltransferase [Actinocrispum wychmicini]TCO60607.1 ubiquinone/menaquinone biosynthesis C-methylase UbiE [Actinocrispum wychmicini]